MVYGYILLSSVNIFDQSINLLISLTAKYVRIIFTVKLNPNNTTDSHRKSYYTLKKCRSYFRRQNFIPSYGSYITI